MKVVGQFEKTFSVNDQAQIVKRFALINVPLFRKLLFKFPATIFLAHNKWFQTNDIVVLPFENTRSLT